VTRTELLAEKVVLAAAAPRGDAGDDDGISAFVHVEWSRFALWVVALAAGGIAFAALGVAIGGLAREVRAASLLAFLMSLPIAFIALVRRTRCRGRSSTCSTPSRPCSVQASLQAMNTALNGAGPSFGGSLLHLAILAVAFGALGRLALRRFA